jgi:hypothetical protein
VCLRLRFSHTEGVLYPQFIKNATSICKKYPFLRESFFLFQESGHFAQKTGGCSGEKRQSIKRERDVDEFKFYIMPDGKNWPFSVFFTTK